MRGATIVIVLAVALNSLLCLHGGIQAQDRKKLQPDEADSTATAQQAARDALAKFDKRPKGAEASIRNWKVRMECLVAMMKAGPGAVPVSGRCVNEEMGTVL